MRGVKLGLRARGLMWMLGLSVTLGGIGMALLTWELRAHHDRVEREALAQDVQRVRLLLADAQEGRQRAAREWSQWSDMRDFALGLQPTFAKENLAASSLRASGLSALVVLDLAGRPLWVQAAQEGQALTLPPAETALGAWMREPGNGCGWLRWAALGEDLQLLCRLPVRDSGGQGATAGSVLTFEPLSTAQMQRLSQLGALNFSLQPSGTPVLGKPALLGGQALHWQALAAEHRLQWSLRDVLGTEVAELVLLWPRSQAGQAQHLLQRVQWLWAAITLGLVALLALLIDFFIVGRVLRLQGQMRDVRESARWQDRLRLRGSDEIGALATEGNHLLARIEGLVNDLEARALTDALTGLGNRRAFDQALKQALGRHQRGGGPLVLAIVDADHFKRFNDTHGHAAGDRALQALAQALRSVARRSGDAVFREGGEEFAWLIEGAEEATAQQLLEGLRARVAALPVDDTLAASLSVSIGATLARDGDEAAGLFERADQALYAAKQAGRNRVAWR